VDAGPALAVLAVLRRLAVAAPAAHATCRRYSQSEQRTSGAVGRASFLTVTRGSPGSSGRLHSTHTARAPRSSLLRIGCSGRSLTVPPRALPEPAVAARGPFLPRSSVVSPDVPCHERLSVGARRDPVRATAAAAFPGGEQHRIAARVGRSVQGPAAMPAAHLVPVDAHRSVVPAPRPGRVPVMVRRSR
jgi:hypothetical protein